MVEIEQNSILRFKRKVGNGYKEFSLGTSLHGFLEIYYAKSIIVKIIWSLVVLAALIVSVYQVCQSTKQYINQSSSSSVQSAKVSEVSYPPMKICLPHWLQWVDFKKAAQLNFTKEAVLYGLSCFGEPINPNHYNAVNAKGEFFSALHFNNFTSPEVFLHSIVKPIGNIVSDVYSLKGDGMRSISPSNFFEHVAIIRTKVCYMATSEKVKFFLQNTGNGLLKSNSVRLIVNINDFKNNPYVGLEEYAWYVAMYVLIDRSEYKLNGKSVYKELDFTEDELYQYERVPFPLQLYVDSFGNTFIDNYIEIVPQIDKYTVAVKAAVNRWMNTQSNPCIEGESHNVQNTTCFDNCMDEFFGRNSWNIDKTQTGINSFSCIADSTSNVTAGIFVEATTERPPNNSSGAYDARIKHCSNVCLLGCEKWRYDVTVASSSVYPAMYFIAYKILTYVDVVYPADGEILIVTEVDRQSWDNFVGNIGGVIGVWTGASIVSFFQVIYLCFCSNVQKS